MNKFLPVFVVVVIIGSVKLCNIASGRKKPSNKVAEYIPEEPVEPKPFMGLTQNWGVLEDNAPVTYVNELNSKNYYVVFDGSGSMDDGDCANGSTKAKVAKKALRKFAQSVPEDARLGLLVFDDNGIAEKLPLGTNNRDDFIREVDSVRPSGTTPLKSALAKGVQSLQQQAIRQRGYGEYNLIVVTDGEAPSDEDPKRVVQHLLKYTPVVVHTIGFCIGESHSLNQPGMTIYGAAQNEQELVEELEEVLAEAESFDLIEFDQK